MNHTARNSEISKLKLRGFKVIPKSRNYYINQSGDIVNLITGNLLKNYPRNEHVRIEGKTLNIAKLVLLTFKKQPYRENQHIEYKDSDKTNYHLSNVKYKRIFKAKAACKVNKADLLTAIRCYFAVNKRFKIKDDTATKIYLSLIYEKRKHKTGNTIIKAAYLYEYYLKSSITETAKNYNLSVRDTEIVINSITNILIINTLNDLEAGKLTIQAYKPRKKTNAQAIKEYFEFSANLKNRLNAD